MATDAAGRPHGEGPAQKQNPDHDDEVRGNSTLGEISGTGRDLTDLAAMPRQARDGVWWDEQSATVLDAALAEVTRGRVVVPACWGNPCQIPWHQDNGPCEGKRPLVKIKSRDSVPTTDRIRGWWRRWPDAQLAILTGARSNLVVIDLDGPAGEKSLAKLEQALGKLPPTMEVKTKHGRHLYFTHPGGKVLTRKGSQFTTWSDDQEPAPGLDTRGDGGLVIAAPSQDRVLANDLEPVELPAGWVGPMSTSATAAAVLTDQEQAEALAQIRTEGEPCSCMERALDKHAQHEGGRHEAMITAQQSIVHLGREGHPGAGDALDRLEAAFLAGKPGAEHEWTRALGGAVAAAMATEPEATGCPYRVKELDLGEDDSDGPSLNELLDNYAARRAKEKAKKPSKKDNYEQAVNQELERLIVRDAAKRRYQAMQAEQLPDPALTTLAELLAEPIEQAVYRVDRLWTRRGNVILAAQRKAGKTTLRDNLTRSLADGDPFLGRGDAQIQAGGYDVDQVDGMVAVLDLELDRGMLHRWLAEQKIANVDRVMVESFRGQTHLFDVLDDKRRGRWAALLAHYGVKVLILDPLGALLDAYGRDENSNSDVGPVLQALDALKAEAGVEELLVVHHMGHNGERSRGASKLRGWPDAEWFLVRERAASGEEPPPDAARFFLAEGRDVMVTETRLEYELAGRRLTAAGGSRIQHKATKDAPAVLTIVTEHPGMSQREITAAAAGQDMKRDPVHAALRSLIADGKIRTEQGPRKALLHFPVEEQAQDNNLDPFAGPVTGS